MRLVGAAGLAAVLFAVIFYLSGTLDVSAEVTFGARSLLTLACSELVLAHPGARRVPRAYWAQVTRSPRTLLLLPLLCALVVV